MDLYARFLCHRLHQMREDIAGALQEFCNSLCKREHVESNTLNSEKQNILIDFYLLIKEFYLSQ